MAALVMILVVFGMGLLIASVFCIIRIGRARSRAERLGGQVSTRGLLGIPEIHLRHRDVADKPDYRAIAARLGRAPDSDADRASG